MFQATVALKLALTFAAVMPPAQEGRGLDIMLLGGQVEALTLGDVHVGGGVGLGVSKHEFFPTFPRFSASLPRASDEFGDALRRRGLIETTLGVSPFLYLPVSWRPGDYGVTAGIFYNMRYGYTNFAVGVSVGL